MPNATKKKKKKKKKILIISMQFAGKGACSGKTRFSDFPTCTNKNGSTIQGNEKINQHYDEDWGYF